VGEHPEATALTVPPPTGFTWSARKNGEIAISRDGRVVTVVRGGAADRLAAQLVGATPDETQHRLAGATGNYRRGNERA
jgi:hypothetical protein